MGQRVNGSGLLRDLTVHDRGGALGDFERRDEVVDRRLDVLGHFDELDPGAIEHDPFPQLADVAVGDPTLDHDRSVTEGNPEVVQGIELEGERGFDLRAAVD